MGNLSISKKSYTVIAIMLASLVALSPFAIDSYLAAMPVMATFFGVHLSVIELTISLYFLGFALGNFIGGPLSDSYGRKQIAVTGIALYGISALLITISPNVECILILRVTQAFGGGFATVTSNVFVRDWYSGKQVARLISIISMIMMLAPLFAPVIGTFLVHAFNWQSVFYFLALYAALLFAVFIIFMPESRDKALLTKTFSAKQLTERYLVFFSDRKSVVFLLAISFSMAGMYIFLTSASFIYISFFKIELQQFPLFFGANVILNIILSLLNTYLLKFYATQNLLKTGLYIQLIAGILLLIFIYTDAPILLNVFFAIVLYIGSLGLVFGNGTAIILNYNPKVSASANATIGISRFLLSFIIGSIISLLHPTNLVPIGTAMFLCALIANVFFIVALKVNTGFSIAEID